ncbi:MAG: PHP domain-containing protein [Candidatus Heimdallarchaeota archaeon]|nr:PHP domain-containing protein [Candidatus Heimdallarchaeota archaeon]
MVAKRYDLHVHSWFSNDCKSNPKDIIKIAIKNGLSGLAITDHNSIKFHHENFKSNELLIIPGVEVSTNRGHVIGLGIKETIKRRLSPEETVEEILDMGGLAIIPHPFDFTRRGIGKIIYDLKNIAVETVNGSCPVKFFNTKAKQMAAKSNLPETGGSDAHRLKDIGMAYTLTTEEITTADDLLEAIRKQRTTGEGSNLTIREKIIRTFQIHF